jgi:uncharacterized protein YcfJ
VLDGKEKEANFMNNETTKVARPNRDPITGTPGAHPIGTGIGAAVLGAATGAGVGTVAGPVGTAAGMVAGAVVGGLAGKEIAEKIDPTAEDTYWRVAYLECSYVDDSSPYETYQPAYRIGYEVYSRFPEKAWDDIEPEMRSAYEKAGYAVGLEWEKAKYATRDAWQRLQNRRQQKKKEKQYA